MKKLAVFVCALIPAVSAFAYDSYGYYSHDDSMSGFAIFSLIVMIAYIVLSIIILVRWWKMTTNVEKIRQHVTHTNQSLTYLILIGEKEQAQKAALTMIIDTLYSMYCDPYNYNKADSMNQVIQERQPKMAKLGLTLPDYVASGEKFIDYVNALTGHKVQYYTTSNYANS